MRSQTIYSSVEAVLAFAGTADAGTLYLAHRSGIQLPCTSGDGCDLVYSSHWSHIGPVPVALIGVAAYVFLLFASVLKLTSVPVSSFRLALLLLILIESLVGTCFSWYLQYVSAVFIGAFCIYCRTSAIIMSLIFLITAYEFILRERVVGGSKADNVSS
jgi:uncharacterized membrane protein